MFGKKILLLSIILVGILAISSVSASENVTDDIVSISDNDVINVENNQDTLSSEESDVLKAEVSNSNESNILKADVSNEEQILQSGISSSVEVLSASNATEIKTDEVLGAVNKDSSEAEPVLKSSKKIKTVKMKVKYKWTTKKVGKFKIKARLWKVRYAYGYHNYLDIILYKNGKQLRCGSYISKYLYKTNGKWKWWPKWRHGGANHAYHRYINDCSIKAFAIKFKC